mmetsp:Transcript_16079/g.32173  ORF Transcript_16079/g.32173 Transcript_16079/m.32173 type:complete len:288 (+) Transcript_16079:137-1000(+)|eukprot:CAMPEP_0181299520 /NCGR_PEP_ID=MMETSP1101-20121128/6393_1 /TAXON_ID=46948 /ORGANISM="Rhodomonas abbreviata, Strain Caron Lab Isolate" /LENGTH=287 /DNA_ID=CAMNT_0023404681 /DNA_START=135 /DNA_END=998 /DNA_ORIENTATION=-
MSASLTPEALIEAAFASGPDPDPELIATVRGDLISRYASKQGVTALLRLTLQKLLIDRPDDPVAYMIKMLSEWKPRTIVILGPPASGKKTLCDILSRRLGLEHVSAGDLVTGCLTLDTEQAIEMRTYKDRGMEVPAEMVEEVVIARLQEKDCCDKGWILDGWPSTAEHAQKLVDAGLGPQIGLVLELPDATVEDRITFRLYNPETGRLFHMQHDPPPLGQTRHCVVRQGEGTKQVLERIEAYHSALPDILAALSRSKGSFQELRVDVDCSMDDFEAMGDRLARTIGV